MKQGDYVFSMSDYFKEEKIDGKIYLMARPGDRHEEVQGNLYNIFGNYFRQNKRRCRIKNEAQLSIDKNNYLIPDLMVFCYNNDRENNKTVPVIVIEVLSKSTYSKDIGVKMKKYAEVGIREYWLVDYKNLTASIFMLEGGRYELFKSYAYYVPEDFCDIPELREKEQSELEIYEEFSPVSFPELSIALEDVFYIVE